MLDKNDSLIVKVIFSEEGKYCVDALGNKYELTYTHVALRSKYIYYSVSKNNVVSGVINLLFLNELEIINGKLIPVEIVTAEDYSYYAYLDKKIDLYYRNLSKIRDEKVVINKRGRAKYIKC